MARNALVTGGTRGIGEGISLALKQAGYGVVANFAGNEQKAKEFTDANGIPTVKFDVGDHDSCVEGIKQAVDQIGGEIDIVVNNAGITRDGFFHKLTKDKWDAVIKTNLDSLFNVTRQVFPGMRERGFGRVINISSINGVAGQAGQTNYSAAKAGLIGFTKALAQEGAGKGVTVNAIAPGYIATEMVSAIDANILEKIVAKIPVGRLGEAHEIARACVFLASDDAGFITGATLNINGGQYMA